MPGVSRERVARWLLRAGDLATGASRSSATSREQPTTAGPAPEPVPSGPHHGHEDLRLSQGRGRFSSTTLSLREAGCLGDRVRGWMTSRWSSSEVGASKTAPRPALPLCVWILGADSKSLRLRDTLHLIPLS